jgi:hypothetical protein
VTELRDFLAEKETAPEKLVSRELILADGDDDPASIGAGFRSTGAPPVLSPTDSPKSSAFSSEPFRSSRGHIRPGHCPITTLSRCRLKRCRHFYTWEREHIELRGDQIAKLTGLLVYSWWRDGTCRYVGLSRRGLRRLFGMHEHFADIGPKDVLRIYPCATVEQAQRLERRLIRKFRPELNKEWNPDHPRWEHGALNGVRQAAAPKPTPSSKQKLTMRQRFAASELGKRRRT